LHICGKAAFLACYYVFANNSFDYLIAIFLRRYPPFYDNEPLGIYKKIINGVIEFPKFFDIKAKDIIRKLLNPDLHLRMGVKDVI